MSERIIKSLTSATNVSMSLSKFTGICASLLIAGFTVSGSYNSMTAEFKNLRHEISLRPTRIEFENLEKSVDDRFAKNEMDHFIYNTKLGISGIVPGIINKEDDIELTTIDS